MRKLNGILKDSAQGWKEIRRCANGSSYCLKNFLPASQTEDRNAVRHECHFPEVTTTRGK